MMDENQPSENANVEATTPGTAAGILRRTPREALLQGNREVITDLYVSKMVENEPKD